MTDYDIDWTETRKYKKVTVSDEGETVFEMKWRKDADGDDIEAVVTQVTIEMLEGADG